METTRTLAKRLGTTTQTLNKWKRKAESQYDCELGSRSKQDARVIEFTPDEVGKILEFANLPETISEPDSEPDCIGSEPGDDIIIDGDILDPVETTGKTSASLVPLNEPIAQAAHLTHFDRHDAATDLAAIQAQGRNTAAAINTTLTSYAAYQARTIKHEIDVTAAAVRANALNAFQSELVPEKKAPSAG